MATFETIADGDEIRIGDEIVGLRGGVDTRFDFPGAGIKDANQYWVVKWETAGGVPVNYPNFINAVTGSPAIIESNGDDPDVELLVRSHGNGDLTLEAPGTGDINLTNTGAGLITMNATTGITGVLDEDDMASDSATHVSTQQATKAYIDGNTSRDASGFFNGLTVDLTTTTVSSNGTTITLSLEKSGGGDIELLFSTGKYTFDSTPAATVSLTAGTDTVPVNNYVYILESTKALTVSTSGFPAAEYAAIATVVCQSAASAQTDGVYKLHAWSDHTVGVNSNGHSQHINEWIRDQEATWRSGIVLTPSVGVNTFDIATTSGVVLQLHEHAFPAFDTSSGSHVYVYNDNATAYNKVTDLTNILTDASGASMADTSFNLIVWGVVSESAGDSQLMVNVPTGSYTNDSSATNDALRTAVYDIPEIFRGTGFLISRLTIKQVSGTSTWSLLNQEDLRPFKRGIAVGTGTGGITSVVEDPTPQLGGDLDTNGNEIQSVASNDLVLNAASGQTLDLQENSTSRMDITSAGVRMGAANSRVTTILDEDDMSSDSATSLATQQSIKAYVDSRQIIAEKTINSPTNSEDETFFYTTDAITVVKLAGVVRGTSPSVTYTIRFGSDRSATGTEVVTGGSTVTSQSTGNIVTSFDDATIPAGSWVWLETTAETGTTNEMHVTIEYTID